MDEWQKKATLEVPDGPQRIRGLAGTGKTIVLALKAAYLHTQHPEWNILVTFSGIYRAKGNESPMVYIMNADYCMTGPEIIKQRNILFTAITRSRAWVRICGVGKSFHTLLSEFSQCKNNDLRLTFKCPNKKEM